MTNRIPEETVKTANLLAALIESIPEPIRGPAVDAAELFLLKLAAKGAMMNEEPKETDQGAKASPE